MSKKTKILFRSSSASIINVVFDGGYLVYLEIAGQEDDVRAITALLMQGLNHQGDDYIVIDEVSFNVRRSGNRRLIEPLGEGQAHCLFFHDSILPSVNMRILIANDDDELFDRFKQWLDLACPLPRLQDEELDRKLYEALYFGDVIEPAQVKIGIKKAVTIDTETLFKDDYELLRESIVAIAKTARTLQVASTATTTDKAIATNDVAKGVFYRDFLKDAPQIGDTSDQEFKKVIASWSSRSATWYAVEYDPKDGRLYVYIKFEELKKCDGWSYWNIKDMEGPLSDEKRYHSDAIERDLDFTDCYIDDRGEIFDAKKIAHILAAGNIPKKRDMVEEQKSDREERKAQTVKKARCYRDYLRNAPSLYATEKQAHRRVIAKWFSPTMTWYAVEYDPNEGLLFGYTVNEIYGEGKWGHFSIAELENLAIGRQGTSRSYVDRDLYFRDRYIDMDGKILDEQEIAQIQATSNVLPAVLAANGVAASNLQAA
jgi:hypothetical protein